MSPGGTQAERWRVMEDDMGSGDTKGDMGAYALSKKHSIFVHRDW